MKLIQRTLVVLGLIVVALAASWLPLRNPGTEGSVSRSTGASTEPSDPAAPTAVPASPPANPPTGAPTATPTMSAADQAIAAEVTRLVNAERARARCGPVRVDGRLAAAALGHSADMARRGYFSHGTAEGGDPWQRAIDAGYPQTTSENIAMGYPTARAVMVAWLDSSGHRTNMLDCAAVAMGIGIARNDAGTPYWTQLFGTR